MCDLHEATIEHREDPLLHSDTPDKCSSLRPLSLFLQQLAVINFEYPVVTKSWDPGNLVWLKHFIVGGIDGGWDS